MGWNNRSTNPVDLPIPSPSRSDSEILVLVRMDSPTDVEGQPALRLFYDREFLLERNRSPLARVQPQCLTEIPEGIFSRRRIFFFSVLFFF